MAFDFFQHFDTQVELASDLVKNLERRGQTRHGSRSLLDIADEVRAHYAGLSGRGLVDEEEIERAREDLYEELVSELKARGIQDGAIWQMVSEMLLAYTKEYNW